MIKAIKISLFLQFVVIHTTIAQSFDPVPVLKYCAEQASKTVAAELPVTQFPRSIAAGENRWFTSDYKSWTSGFWPGTLWYLYETDGSEQWRKNAEAATQALAPLLQNKIFDHDIGFQIFCSYGNGLRLTANQFYKPIILAAADSLAKLYHPKVGTILSWPFMTERMKWPHNTIIDNMMNLELLFWASKHGGDKNLYQLAKKHALTTMKNHFREDYSAYHVIVYDTLSGKKIKGVTYQGYADDSMWARGQAWAIYGYTLCYRETGDKKFLDFAQKVADVYLKILPEDGIPYWDFDDPAIPATQRDASAAAVTASALLELSSFVKNKGKAANYLSKATTMLKTLSSEKYLSGDRNSAFLLHSTGFMAKKSEVDASIIYADYYFIEALLRYKNLKK